MSTPDRQQLGAALGAHVNQSNTRFSLYTTVASSCAVRLFNPDGSPRKTLPMTALGDGRFETTTDEAPAGSLYKFVLDGAEFPDPYARFLPHGVHGAARVEASEYVWRHPNVHRPLSEQVIYELHLGAFTPEGTYRAAAAHLGALCDLGVTTLELMPVAAFAGARGWGYDGVALFAPFAPYGEPDDLRAFIDAAHGLGLGVLLDAVYNHLGPSGNYLSAYSPSYFSRHVRNAWGAAPDYAHAPMRALVLDNARYWLEAFRFDGLRLDATHAIVDPSPQHVLEALSAEAHALQPPRALIAEDDRNDPRIITTTHLDAVWADDFHHAVRVTLTGERDGYYAAYAPGVAEIAQTINRGWRYEGEVYAPTHAPRGQRADALAASAFVYCLQNHDQTGNRALGERLSHEVSLDAYRMVSALLLFLPMTPLLFMGQEWAASTPFLYFTDHDPELGALVSAGRREEFKGFRAFSDPAVRAQIPDPQSPETFARSHLRWSERDEGDHARTLSLYRALLSLRRDDDVLKNAVREGLFADTVGSVLRVRREHEGEARVLLANFSSQRIDPRALVAPDARVLLATGDGDDLAPWSARVMGTAAKAPSRAMPVT